MWYFFLLFLSSNTSVAGFQVQTHTFSIAYSNGRGKKWCTIWNFAFTWRNRQQKPMQCYKRLMDSLFFSTAELEDDLGCLRKGDNQFQRKVELKFQSLHLRKSTSTPLLLIVREDHRMTLWALWEILQISMLPTCW